MSTAVEMKGMSLHKEISFESEICQHLANHGWLYAEGDLSACDPAQAGAAGLSPA